VALQLSDKDVAALYAVMTVLLTPLSYDDRDEWERAVSSALQILGVDSDATGPSPPELNKRKQMLRLMAPALHAGVTSYAGLARWQASLVSFIDSAPIGVTLFTPGAASIHENTALRTLLAGDPERIRVRSEISRVCSRVSAIAARRALVDALNATVQEIRTVVGRYRITVTLVEAGLLTSQTSVMAITERVVPIRVEAQEVATRFGLTHREAEVAHLMRSGFSNREIASALGISINTARRHTERVLAKLDVHSRIAAAVRLNGN
jgi:DNA-binding CsgD family transcriptional regulator